MTHDDFENFREILSAIGDIYGKKVSEFALSIWWGALKNYDLAAIRDALSRHVINPDSGQYMPKPADVVRMIGGTTTDSALVAWSKVDKAVREIGTYQDVVFDDPLIHRVIDDMGGWVALGTKTADEWPFVAREFETRYRGYASRQAKPEYQGILTGIANAQNRRNGFPCFAPVLIGDTTRAQQVMELGGNRPRQFARIGEQVPVLATAPKTEAA